MENELFCFLFAVTHSCGHGTDLQDVLGTRWSVCWVTSTGLIIIYCCSSKQARVAIELHENFPVVSLSLASNT